MCHARRSRGQGDGEAERSRGAKDDETTLVEMDADDVPPRYVASSKVAHGTCESDLWVAVKRAVEMSVVLVRLRQWGLSPANSIRLI